MDFFLNFLQELVVIEEFIRKYLFWKAKNHFIQFLILRKGKIFFYFYFIKQRNNTHNNEITSPSVNFYSIGLFGFFNFYCRI